MSDKYKSFLRPIKTPTGDDARLDLVKIFGHAPVSLVGTAHPDSRNGENISLIANFISNKHPVIARNALLSEDEQQIVIKALELYDRVNSNSSSSDVVDLIYKIEAK